MTTRLSNTVARLEKEIERLPSQLAAARREAIEECINALPSDDERADAWDEPIDAAVLALTALISAPTAPALAPLREAVEFTGGACEPNLSGDPGEGRSTGEPAGPGIGDDPTAPPVKPLAALRDDVVTAAMRQWHWLKCNGEADGQELAEACAALSAASATAEEGS